MITPIQKNITPRAEKRFRMFSLKPIMLTMTLIIAGMLFSSTAFANRWQVRKLTLGNQVRTATYGTAAAGGTAITFSITLNESFVSGAQSQNKLTITWVDGAPAGVTTSLDAGVNYTLNGDGQAFTLTITTTAAAPAGSYDFVVATTENNGGTAKSDNGTLIIGKKSVTVTGLTASNKVYDGTTAASFTGGTLNGVLAADAGNVALVASGTFSSKNVGTNITVTSTSTLSGSAAGNYTISPQPTGLKANITAAPLSIDANSVTKTYGQGLTNGQVTTGFTPTGLQNGETVGHVNIVYGTGGSAASAVGTYIGTVSISGAGGGTYTAGNYGTITYTKGDITVNPAVLTITATDKTKTFGAANPTFTFTSSGYVNGNNSSIITTQPTYTTTATTTSAPGDYDIIPGGAALSNANYTINYVNGTLTIQSPTLFDWTGAVSTAWNDGRNWSSNGTQLTQAVYPGVGNNDDARIGVTGTITNQPIISASLSNGLNSLTFGNSSGATTLTVNAAAALNVDAFTMNANSTANLVDNGSVNVGQSYTNNAGAALTVSGLSTFSVTSNSLVITNSGTLIQSGNGTITFTAVSITNSGSITQSSTGGILSFTTILGSITNTGTINQSGNGTMSFSVNFNFFGSSIINSGTISQTNNGKINFLSPYYNSTTGSVLTQTGTGTLAFSSTFNNSGTTTFGPGTITMADDFTNTTGTTTFGSGPATLSGAFTNTAGSTTFGTGLVTFNSTGGNTKITNTPNSTLTFVNVLFTKGHFLFKTGGGSSSNLAIASTGVMTLSSNAQLDFANVNQLILLSDVNSSATIAAIPAGCAINATGKVAVQRFIQGSTDLSKRGYRLLSSTVYTGSENGINFYDLDYLKKSVHLSGPGYAANGFDVTSTANPTIYLFREDVAPPPSGTTAFTTGYNWKGVAKINDAPLYKIGTQAKTTTANIFDASYNLPVGNGILFFFRGDISQAVTPIGPPNDVILTQVGTLNTGTIKTNIWFAAEDGLAANTFSHTDPSTDPAYTNSSSRLRAGFALVGNPYPSTINWEKYNKTAANGALTGGVSTTIYTFNVVTKQYDTYQANQDNNTDFTSEFTNTSDGSVGGTATGAASNFIASGQGFFVIATALGQTLTFNETAKISAQPTATNLNMMMGKPADMVKAAPVPLLRLKLSVDSINTDDIVIRLRNNSSAKFVSGEDAVDLGGSGNLVSLSSFSADSIGVPLAINTMPFPGVKPEIVQLAVSASASGTYKLSMPKLANLPALYNVWLKDAFTADSLKLTEGASYTFTIDKANAATFGNTRFTLIIGQDTAKAYKLLDFTATKTDHKTEVELVWKTANEGNYTNFTVERSEGRRKPFEVVGGMRSTDAGTYSILDKRPDNKKNFYRLKQVDINDSVTYSDVVEVKFADKRDQYAHNLNIYPNPASHNINLSIKDDHDKGRVSYSINFVNCFGMIVKQVNSSQADWQGNVSNLRPGTYLVKVVNNKTQNLIGENKFVKL